MAPKWRPRRGLLAYDPEHLQSDEQRRVRLGVSAVAGDEVVPGPVTPPLSCSGSSLAVPAPRTPDSLLVAGPLPGHLLVGCAGRRARSDVPVPRNVRRGGVDVAIGSFDQLGIGELVHALHLDRESASARGTREQLLKTWRRFHSLAFGGVDSDSFLPLTPERVQAVGSLFKAGKYRSFPNYLSAAKIAHVEAGHHWDQQVELVAKWVSRSVLRGIGPARQSCAFKMSRLLALPRSMRALAEGGPQWPVHAVLLGTLYLMREVELAATQVRHLSFNHDLQEVTWELSMSKTDPLALGTRRTWGCLCGVPALPCPYHLAHEHVQAVRAHAITACLMDPDSLPLFHTGTGEVPSKASMVHTFEAIGGLCGMPLRNKDGLRLFGGHSLRVTGAQALAACGIEISKLRILARHSGDAIMRYVADSPLASLRTDLGLVPRVGEASSSSSSSSSVRASIDELAVGHRLLLAKVDAALTQLAAHEARLAAPSSVPVVRGPRAPFCQNMRTLAVHALRSLDKGRTICGWDISLVAHDAGALQFVTDLHTQPHWRWCERCLLTEKRAAELASIAVAPCADSDDEL